MAPDPARTGPARIRQAVKAITARIHSPDERGRKLTISLPTGRDANVTPGPDFPDARLPAPLPQRTEPVQAASPRVRRLYLADQPAFQPSRP